MSATVPMELTFGSGGNLKSVKRLRGLDLKDRLSNISNGRGGSTRPVFANTGQILKKAQRAGPITPRGGGVPGTGSPIGGRSTVPTPPPPAILQELANQQGDADGGGAVVPEQVAQDIQQGAAGKPAGRKLSGKTIAIGGGVAVAALIIVYFLFFSKKRRKGRKRKR